MGNRFLLSLVFLIGINIPFFGQSRFVYQPEIILGHIVPNFQNYPTSGLLHGVGLSISVAEPEGYWKASFPKAKTGVFVGGWNLGNDTIFGTAFTAYPFVEFPINIRKNSHWFVRVGLGAAYFTKHHSPTYNIRNAAIGSALTWAFEGSLTWEKQLRSYLDLTLSGKFLHGSNGHVQLPNFGLNSAALGVGLRFYPKGIVPKATPIIQIEKQKKYSFQVRAGIGLHEFGGTHGPTNGGKYGIQYVAVTRNILYNNKNKVKLGFVFRHYNSYALYIKNAGLSNKIKPNSLSFILGHEFLFGHIGINVDGLLQLYKPFYRTYFDLYGSDSRIMYLLHRYLGARVGFNIYLFPPSSDKRNNLFLGLHLNTNNGEADFSAIGIGYEYGF